MTTLESSFEKELRNSLDDGLEKQSKAIGESLKQTAEQNFKEYAAENGYSLSHIWQDAELNVEQDANGYTVRVEWPGLTALFEYGVDPHTIEGNPLLAFYWDSPPEGTRPAGAPAFVEAQSVNWGSVTGGIPESRAIRGALDYIRFELDGSVSL